MTSHKIIGICFCLVAIWLQYIAPAAAYNHAASDPYSLEVICSGSAGQGQGQSHPPLTHHHCPWCQICVGALLFPERPPYTALDYPAASPLRWQLFSLVEFPFIGFRPSQPRGPPSAV